MRRITRYLLPAWMVAVAFAILVPVPAARAVNATDLFAAEVSAEELGEAGRSGAFRIALGRALVKVTGRRDAAADAELIARFGDPEALVQQYRNVEDGGLWVRFDPSAMRRVLDAAGQPVWPAERPLTLAWIALDYGGGQRALLPAETAEDKRPALPGRDDTDRRSEVEASMRDALLEAAAERGLPLLLPLVDSEDLQAVSVADVWGDFIDPIARASQRYNADTLLIGRARTFAGEAPRVRWTLLLGSERFEWDGSMGDGPQDTADVLASRLSASAGAAGRIRVHVDDVDSLDAYGRVTSYLQSLGIVDRVDVEQVDRRGVTFSLSVRGDRDRLMRTIALERLLEPLDPGRQPGAVPPGMPELHYRLAARD